MEKVLPNWMRYKGMNKWLKEVFDFCQPQEQIAQAQPDVPFPVESDSELKKKEESISPSTSDGSSLASTSQSNI